MFFSFVVGLYFRALSDDGLLLYGTDNDTHPTQFFSLELVRGRLVYKFDSGRGLVSMTTKDKYSGKGVWYRVCGLSLTVQLRKSKFENRKRSSNCCHLLVNSSVTSYIQQLY